MELVETLAAAIERSKASMATAHANLFEAMHWKGEFHAMEEAKDVLEAPLNRAREPESELSSEKRALAISTSFPSFMA